MEQEKSSSIDMSRPLKRMKLQLPILLVALVSFAAAITVTVIILKKKKK